MKSLPQENTHTLKMDNPSSSVEARLAAIESKLNCVEKMVREIHTHVGFVDDLSQIYTRLKERSVSTVSRVATAIGI